MPRKKLTAPASLGQPVNKSDLPDQQLQDAIAKEGSLKRHRVSDLLDGQREAILEHRGQDYRLRITAAGKLILTK